MQQTLDFKLNGRLVRLEGVSANLTLLQALRNLGLTGSKEGCAEGDCGACSVVMVSRDGHGRPAYRAVNSCLMPVCLAAGREIISVEGIAAGETLHPVQEEMVGGHGSQCGYCTPGFICSLFEGYYRDSLQGGRDLNAQLAGNLCRCTGYRAIRAAALRAFARRSADDPFAQLLAHATVEPGNVQYDSGVDEFIRPTSLSDLLRLLREMPHARLVAGSTELGLDITKRFRRFQALISTESVPELAGVQFDGRAWRVGGAATLTEIEEVIDLPEMRDMLEVFGSRQIRNRATMAGNLATASPIGDCAPVLLALDAEIVAVSASDDGSDAAPPERRIPISEFFTGYRKTALRSGEIIKSIVIPRPAGAAEGVRLARWFKVSRRREMDISTVSACLAVELDREKVVRKARLAFGGVAATPARAFAAERLLEDHPWETRDMDAIRNALQREFTPLSDVRGSREYRAGVITGLFEEFCQQPQGAERMEFPAPPAEASVHGACAPHESARLHVTGAAKYTDDLAGAENFLEVWPVCSPHAHARIIQTDATEAKIMSGIRAVLCASDIPGANNTGPARHDEPLLADGEAHFHGQIVALVVGESEDQCRAAAAMVKVEYEPLPAILGLGEAVAQDSFQGEPNLITRGDCEAALRSAPCVLEGDFELGGQEHFYLETQAAWARPEESGAVLVCSATQHPSEVQQIVAHTLNVPAAKVAVTCPRMGGGFGGKETQAAAPAALAALAAVKCGAPVRVRWNRDQDMMLTGHRHPFLARFKVGYDREGHLLAARVHLWSDGGWSLDLSQAVTDRATLHLDNAYFIPAVEFRGRVARTNKSSNTAFRGFGGPQGMLVMEEIIDRIARKLSLAPETVRERNLYHGSGETSTTPYGQAIENNRLPGIWEELKRTSDLPARRLEIDRWNGCHSHLRRGIAMTPVKFGISFTVSHFNQAGAFVLIYQDGSVQVNHGGTEMGQGVHTNVLEIVRRELGVRSDQVRVMPTATDKVPNTSATAASTGTDLNGAAARDACGHLLTRLRPVAARLFAERFKRDPMPAELIFADGFVSDGVERVPFADLTRRAWQERVSLSATGHYATPGIKWDRVQGRGKPFHYFAFGAAVAEVEVNIHTGMHRLRRADILHDVGESINTGINLGQVEGGFVQGAGWLTMEELVWDRDGRLLTHSPDTYKIPAVGDAPAIFNVSFVKHAPQPGVVFGSKAVGEPPFMLAISVREAMRDALRGFHPPGAEIPLASPATAEAFWRAMLPKEMDIAP